MNNDLHEARRFTSRELRIKASQSLRELGISVPTEEQIASFVENLKNIIKSNGLGIVMEDEAPDEGGVELPTFESFLFEGRKEETLELESTRNGAKIVLTLQGKRIQKIDNPRRMRFPWSIGEVLNRSLETWACNNGFTIDGVDPCPEEKIFGVKVSQVPRDHEWRTVFPRKFKD